MALLESRNIATVTSPASTSNLDDFIADAADALASEVQDWQKSLSPEKHALIESAVRQEAPCFILGCNPNAEFIANHVPVAGFLDDNTPPGTNWLGRAVIPGDKIPASAIVINAVLHRRPQQAWSRLCALPVKALQYADLCRLNPERFPPLPFVKEAHEVLESRGPELADLARKLGDQESISVLHDVWMYRLTGDPAFTSSYALRDEAQYFDLPLQLPDEPIFVDGGAFRGETTEQFLHYHPDARQIWLFEPNPESLAAARRRLAGRAGLHFLPYALGDRRTHLAFDGTAANASRISKEGGMSVEVVPLDEVIAGPVHFIKFDLEGYESKALSGARRLIREHAPHLAICVYHHPEDFLEVPRVVALVRDDYQLRLRHYTEGWEETVLYFSRQV